MTKSCISCHVCLNNIFLATYKGMRCSTRLLHSSVLIMLASVGFHLNEWNDLIKQMVAIPSHLTDKTNSLKSNTTISRYIRVTFKTFNVWTQHLFVCCTVRHLDWQQILGGSGLLWGVQSMLDCVRLWGVLRSVWCLWPFVSFKQFQSSFSSVAGCIGPPPNQLAVPSWASKQLQVSNWSLSSYWREFFSCHQAVAHREWSDCFFFSIIVESLLNK